MALIPVWSRLYHIFLLVFPDLGTINIWGQITVYRWGAVLCIVRHLTTLRVSTLQISVAPPSHDNQRCLWTLQMSAGDKNHLWFKATTSHGAKCYTRLQSCERHSSEPSVNSLILIASL